MTEDFIYNFIRQYKFGVLATVSPNNKFESAYVGIVPTPELKIIFGTTSDSRKYENLLSDLNIAFVIGWKNKRTVQYEGLATILSGNDLGSLKQTYYTVFPDRKQPWKTGPIPHFSK